MKRIIKAIPRPLVFLFLTYLSGIIIFFLFRLGLILIYASATKEIPLAEILQAQFMGFRFDTVVSGYILALPQVLFFFTGIFPQTQNTIKRFSFIWIYILYFLSFFICAADIPYFLQFNSRLTIAAMTWTDTPAMMTKIVFQDVRNYPFLALFVFSAAVFYVCLKQIEKYSFKRNNLPVRTKTSGAIFYLLAAVVLIIGIRGRIGEKSPIRWGTAFFSQHAFANQLGLNPVFTFGRSWLDSRNPENQKLNLMDEMTAFNNTREFLGMENYPQLYSPIAREVSAEGSERRYNIVLIIMESMAAWKMGAFGNKGNLTPHLDSIAQQSIFFTNFYSSGMHTFSGVYSALFGMPVLPGKHAMKDLESNQPFSGTAKVLSERNYNTVFFCTHDEQFDNMGGFLSANGFQNIVSEKDYPSEKSLSTLGVPDHVMFDFSFNELDRASREGKPFFAAYLTGSDHPPYIVPKDIPFKPKSDEVQQRIVEYADWSVNHFLEECHKRPWADSTIFIITADHGSVHNAVYDADLSLTHTFLVIHQPKILQGKQWIEDFGGQLDIFPTTMGLLNISYTHNTPGINLMKEKRPFIYFCVDENTGCVGSEYYIVLRRNGDATLYRYRERETKNYLTEKQSLADSMKIYVQSNLQTVQQMILRRVVY
jgi:phosphoglycerol transferase MdoB-like AlkP superfamily enzyme